MVNLTKGEKVNLVKESPGLSSVAVGLGWDPSGAPGVSFDLDSSAFLLDTSGKVVSDSHFIFFNNKTSPDGAVIGAEDDRTGDSSDGDDEIINIALDRVESSVESIAICVDIHDADEKGQNFGEVRDAFVRIVDVRTNDEIVRYDLTGDYSRSNAIVFGILRRVSGDWEFQAIGEGYSEGLVGLCRLYGVAV
jgi:tellurium resistance protein TerD